MITINPYTLSKSEISETLKPVDIFETTKSNHLAWRQTPISSRIKALAVAFERFIQQRKTIIDLLAEEVGKPIKHGAFEFDRAIEEWRYMLDNASDFLHPEMINGGAVHFDPLGIVAVISPWNFPVMLPLRSIIPALLAGNSVIFKPSELSPRSGLALSSVLSATAVTESVKQVPLSVIIGGKDLGAWLVEQPVAGIAFTGSSDVGKAIARQAANSLKRLSLELGGLDPAIVLSDSDLPSSALEIVRANARNSGQTCNSIKRVFVQRDIYQAFVKEATIALGSLIYGDPFSPNTDIGPLVSEVQFKRVKHYLDDAVARGAVTIVADAPKCGYIFPQTILTNVDPSSLLLSEEPFGPLLPIIPFEREDEVITLANSTRFGLTASIWTQDSAAFTRISSRLDFGMVRRNTHAAMPSGIPWGGCKESGLGRTKTREGLREFTNIKVIA